MSLTRAGYVDPSAATVYHHNNQIQFKSAFAFIEVYLSKYKLPLSGPILDFGCGDGKLTATISESFHQPITGVDISSARIQFASANYSNEQVHFVQSSAHEFYSYTQYGTVVSFNALHHMPRSHHPIVFDNASSLLKEDGVALFLVPGQGCVLHEAMENVCKADRWVSTFSDFDLHKVRSYENADYYKQVCFAAGFNDVDSSFSGVVEEGELSFEELIGFMSGWLPHLAHLEVKENNSAMLEEHKSALLKDIATLFFAYKHTSLKEKAKLQSYENRIIASKISLFSHNSSLASLGDEVKCAQEIAMTRP